MSERAARRTAAAVGTLEAVLAVVNVVLLVLGREELSNSQADDLLNTVITLAGVLYPAIGLLIAVRARNAIGWWLTTVGMCYALVVFGALYATVGLLSFPGSLPVAEEVASLLGHLWIAAFPILGFLLLLFPTGRPPSRRWQPVLWLGIGSVAATYLGFLVKSAPIEPVATLSFPNPFAVKADVLGPVLVVTSWLTVLAALGGPLEVLSSSSSGTKFLGRGPAPEYIS